MNATVQRIVELLFEDLEMSAEVQAIKDEVMNNCQERYEDLLAQGLSEDEAIAAIYAGKIVSGEIIVDSTR